MLGVIGFLAVCMIAAFFPTLTAYLIFGVIAVLAVPHIRDRWRATHRK